MNLSAPSRGLAALGLALAQGIALHAAAAVWYVDAANLSPQQDGASWATAFSTIQPAIDAAHADGGGEVWVAAGVYDEERVFINEFNADAGALELKGGVILIGGFAGDETEASQRDSSENITVIDGSAARAGVPAINVIRVTGPAEIDGFTVTGGRADESAMFPIGTAGGGLYATNHVEIRNCLFKNNVAETSGGAIRSGSLTNSRLMIENCVFDGNKIGCVSASYGPTIIRKCTFTNNTGTLIAIGSGTVSECWFDNNVGLAMSQFVGSSRFINCVFSRNQASALFYCSGSIDGFTGEFTTQSTISNCTFFGNGIELPESSIFRVKEVRLNIDNSVFWGNDGALVRRANLDERSFVRVRNSVFESGFGPSHVGQIDADPLLIAPGLGNFRLRPGSPAIDAGLETDAPATDFDGAPRPVGDGVDIGAFEFDPKTFEDPYDTDGNGAVNALDIQRVVNQGLGMNDCPFACDIDGDGLFDAVDVQFIINAAMGIR